MSQHRKRRGYASQQIVADYLKDHGFPFAEPVGAGRSGSDITGTIGIDFEIKARRGFPVAETMAQLRERREDGGLGVAVLRMDGMGAKSIEDWPALLRLADLVALLRDAGWGDPRKDGAA